MSAIGTADLAPGQAEAVEELVAEFDTGEAGDREMLVRETLEAIALG